MRRTLGFAVGVCLALVLGSVGGVSEEPRQDANVLTRVMDVEPSVLQGLAEAQPDIVALEKGPQAGTVLLRVLVSKTGEVQFANASQGDPLLRQAAADGVKGWKYRPYLLDGEPHEVQSIVGVEFRDGRGKPASVAGLVGTGIGGDARTGSLPIVSAGQRDVPPGPVRVSADVFAGRLVHRTNPEYPRIAWAMRVQGAVLLRAIVSKTGDVKNLQVISGSPMLTAAALDAVKQWKYTPWMLNGEPVEVDTVVVVNFIMGAAPRP